MANLLITRNFFDIIDYILEEKINVAILSSLAVPRKVAYRLSRAIEGVEFINFQVSLDSIRPEINDISRGKTTLVLSNIELFLEKEVDIQLASVIANHNIDYLTEIIDRYYPRVKRFHFMNVMPSVKVSKNDNMLDLVPHTGRTKQFWKDLLTQYGRRIVTNPPSIRNSNEDQSFCFQGCSAGHLFCVIDSTLDVLACNMAKTFILGNLRDNTFDAIWYSKEAAKIRSESTPLCHMYVSESTKTELVNNKALKLNGAGTGKRQIGF